MIGYYCQITTKALKYPNQKFLGIKQPLLRNYSCCKGMKLSFTCTDKYSQLKLRRSEALNKHSLQLVSMRIISISGDKMTPISELDDRKQTPNFVRWHKGTDIVGYSTYLYGCMSKKARIVWFCTLQ